MSLNNMTQTNEPPFSIEDTILINLRAAELARSTTADEIQAIIQQMHPTFLASLAEDNIDPIKFHFSKVAAAELQNHRRNHTQNQGRRPGHGRSHSRSQSQSQSQSQSGSRSQSRNQAQAQSQSQSQSQNWNSDGEWTQKQKQSQSSPDDGPESGFRYEDEGHQCQEQHQSG